MDYGAALSYLNSLQSTKIKLGLERILSVCDAMGHPERLFPSIIIAGTNGKGSTCAFLESILRHNGLKVGLYTSPHLIDVRERIQINRRMILEEDFARMTEYCSSVAKRSQEPLTYFEFLTIMTFAYFAEQKVDMAVLEVGLGGRLDATNVVTPLASIITRIGIDHCDYLGNTIEKIALEKCGVIKDGIPVVTVDQDSEAMDVIRRVADDKKSVLHVVSPSEVKWPLGLLGDHQLENAACAVRAAEIISETALRFTIHASQIKTPLAATTWPGRLEIISQDPLIMLDGAHNPNGAEALAKYIQETYPHRYKIIIFGVMADKDIKGIIKPLAEVTDELIITRPSTTRAADPNTIYQLINSKAQKLKSSIKIIEPLNSAISQTLKLMPRNAVLIITGSLYTVEEVKKYFK